MNKVLSLLRERGLRPTLTRLKLLSVLSEADHERMTAEQIFMMVTNGGSSISLASVYRVLKELGDSGIVERGWCQDGQEVRLLFSLRRAELKNAEPELFCVSCRRSVVLPMPKLRSQLNRLAEAHQLQPEGRPILIHITCPACANG